MAHERSGQCVSRRCPTGLLTDDAVLQAPPEAISPIRILPDELADAWGNGVATGLSISVALSKKAGKNLPWAVLREAIDSAVRTRILERTDELRCMAVRLRWRQRSQTTLASRRTAVLKSSTSTTKTWNTGRPGGSAFGSDSGSCRSNRRTDESRGGTGSQFLLANSTSR